MGLGVPQTGALASQAALPWRVSQSPEEREAEVPPSNQSGRRDHPHDFPTRMLYLSYQHNAWPCQAERPLPAVWEELPRVQRLSSAVAQAATAYPAPSPAPTALWAATFRALEASVDYTQDWVLPSPREAGYPGLTGIPTPD